LTKTRIENRDDLASFKRKMAKKYKIGCLSNAELFKVYQKEVKKKSPLLEDLLRTRPVRSLSGIVNVSVLTKPYPCPGKCIYCPTQKGIPKSYIDKEPAVQRALLTNFSPYEQVKARLRSLEKTGHPLDKIELRIIGGTWSFYPKSYKEWFIKECFRAANEYKRKRKTRVKKLTLQEAQKANENAPCRIVGITIETRPDYITKEEIKEMRELGITRVELGVQSIYNDVLKITERGHSPQSTIQATQLLKDAGFKVCYQIMLNLPDSSPQRDIEMVKEIFSSQEFQPDLLKIYPLALLRNTLLYKWYKRGKFKVYDKNTLLNTLIEIKKLVPYWCRIQRIIRDFPSSEIVEGGAKISNLREIVQKEMEKRKIRCKCIRCREVKENYNPKEKLYLFQETYDASFGKEIFLSFEDKKRKYLYALLRLRIPSQNFTKEKHFIPCLRRAALIREVHTYGKMVSIGKALSAPQHKGLGRKLMKKAEEIAKKEFGLNKVAVISGVGVRNYYRKLGYRLKDTYMIKNLSQNT